MLVLGIESSCDETCCAVVRDARDVLSNVISSQHDLHAEYGGVVPEIASRAHVEALLPVLRESLKAAGVELSNIEAIAVGNRPGLIGSLLVGVAGAKALSLALGVPLIGVDHIQAHLYAPLLGDDAPDEEVYPALGLVVSGGHSSIYRCDSALEMVRIGSTIDDAIGEAYDKVGVLVGLEHPGGPKVDKLAREGDDRAFDLPISRLGKESIDFSFSGLKTAVLYRVKGVPGKNETPPELDDKRRADLCASFQRAAIGAVLLKLERALEQMSERPKSLLVGGGVSANSRLRADLKDFGERHGVAVRVPAMQYCLDNGAMIAGLGSVRLGAGLVDDLTLEAVPTTGA